MADARMDGRFSNLVRVVNQSCTQTSNATTTAAYVKGSKVVLEYGEVQAGTTIRWKCAGTKTGTNAAHTLALWASNASSALLTLTSDDATAVDWSAEIVCVFYGGALQKIFGTMTSDTTDCEGDYVAGTNASSAGMELTLKVASGHTSDTVTTEVCVTEQWQAPLEA